jgi:hypothetical protein
MRVLITHNRCSFHIKAMAWAAKQGQAGPAHPAQLAAIHDIASRKRLQVICAKMESNILTMANVTERELIESAAQIVQEKCTREAVLLATGNAAHPL